MSLSRSAMLFSQLREGLLGPTLSSAELSGVQAILAACEGWPIAYAAYALATAYHETAHTMQPVRERGGDAYFRRMYDPFGDRPKVAASLGNTHSGDGVLYCGRGYVQLTGRRNYAKAEAKTGFPLIDQPYLAERADVSASILRSGMAEGWFTGKKLADYLPGTAAGADLAAFTRARKVINGSDRAALIADYAQGFQTALRAGGWS